MGAAAVCSAFHRPLCCFSRRLALLLPALLLAIAGFLVAAGGLRFCQPAGPAGRKEKEEEEGRKGTMGEERRRREEGGGRLKKRKGWTEERNVEREKKKGRATGEGE